MPTASGFVVLGHVERDGQVRRYWSLTALHAGKWYKMERTRREGGVLTPRMALYRESEFPPDMLTNLLEQGHVRRVSVEWCERHGFGAIDAVELRAGDCAPG